MPDLSNRWLANWDRTFREHFTFLIRCLAEIWMRTQLLWAAVHPARVSLLAVLFAGGALLFTEQGQDIYIEIAEYEQPFRWLGLFLGSLALTLMAWYCARSAVTLKGLKLIPYRVALRRQEVPRWIGYWGHVLVAAGLLRAANGERVPDWLLLALMAALGVGGIRFVKHWEEVIERRHTREELRTRAPFYLVLALVLGAVVAGLGRFLTENFQTGTDVKLVVLAGFVLAQGAIFLLFVRLRRQLFACAKVTDEPDESQRRATRMIVRVLAIASLLGFILFGGFPVFWGRWVLGPAFVVLLLLCWPIGLGTWLTNRSRRESFPALTSLVLVTALLMKATAPYNDGHHLRVVDSKRIRFEDEQLKDDRPTLPQVFKDWRDKEGRLRPDGKPAPCFIVATEGGGSRAAYWTATVLGRLQDSNQDFADHLLAISSVSGGSFGAVTFRALLADGKQDTEKKGQQVTGDDHLSPQLARLLTFDLLQFPLLLPWAGDRGVALEEGREASWRQFIKSDRFKEPFLELWTSQTGQQQPDWPALFINSTVVESGRRAVVSNVRLHDGAAFEEAYDLLAEIGKDLPLSTAGDTSSRFPYVSPPGTFTTVKDKRGHVVDGGYFENFGATTALDILQALESQLKQVKGIAPVIIQISNSSQVPPKVGDWQNPGNGPERACDYKPITTGLETSTPPRTLLATRNARGWTDTERLRHAVATLQGKYIHFRLPYGIKGIPTGRILSRRAKNILCNSLGSRSSCENEAGRGIEEIDKETEKAMKSNRAAIQAVLGYLEKGVLADNPPGSP